MNVLTCQQVEEQLDLLAAGECDRPTRRAVEQHLDHCATCSASYAESRRLQGLLALHWNEADQLARLRQRIDVADREGWRARRLVLPWMRPVVALAALLLMTFGLALLMPKDNEEQPAITLSVAAVPMRGGPMKLEMMKAKVDAVPGPPEVDAPAVATLDLKNTGALPVEIYLDGAEAQWKLEVRGPAQGIVRVPAPKQEVAAFLPQKTLRLRPGEGRSLPIKRFLDGSGQHLEYVYLTEPGDYTLTIHLRAIVGHEPLWLTSAPVRIQVVDR